MRSEGGFVVGGAGEAGETGANAVGPAVSTESVPRVELLENAVGWTTVVAAAGAASVEPVPTPVGTAKNEAKTLSAADKARPRPGQRSTVATEAETRAKLSEGIERSSILIRGPCVRKSLKSAEVKGCPPKTALSVEGTSPPKPTPGIGEEGVFSPQPL